jgi:DNA repair exonuclease SbcCD ATPase subunit
MLEEQASADKLAAVRKAKQDAEQSVAKARTASDAAKAEREKAAKDESSAIESWNRQSKLREKHEMLRLEAEKRKAIAEKLEKELSSAKRRTKEEVLKLEKDAATAQEKIAQKKSELSALIAKGNALASEAGAAEAAIRQRRESAAREAGLKKEIDTALGGITLDQAGKEAEIVEERLEQKKAEAMSLRGKMAELEKSLAELRRDMAHCPVCETELGPEKKKELRVKREAEIAGAKSGERSALDEAAKLEKDFRARLASITKAEVAMKSLASLATGKGAGESEDELNAKLAAAKAAISRNQEARQLAEKENDAILKSLDEAKLALREEQELEKKRMEQAENLKRAGEAQAALEALGFSQTDYDTSRQVLETARVALGVVAEKERGALRELKLAEQMLAQAAGEEKGLAGLVEMGRAYAGEEQRMVVFKNSIVEAQAQIRQELIGAINSAMDEIWPTVYPYGDYKSVRIQPDAKDYSLEMMSLSGEWKPMDAVASGGERACACLALRAAFAMVLTPNLSWLILDEPTHNLDASAVSALAETLRERLPKIVGQIFVITHDQALMDSEFALAYKFSRDKEKNMPSSVERA